MPLLKTSGNNTADAYAGGVAAIPNYIEDVFSTYLYTGNSSSQTITNGIDLAGKGGMVWFKGRNLAVPGNIFDTVRNNGYLTTNSTDAVNAAGGGAPPSSGIYPFNSNGFTLADSLGYWNTSPYNYASWTFRKQPKFFDVVPFTGNGTTQNIAHSLAGAVGTLIIKRTDTGGSNWMTYHRSLPTDECLALNTTEASSAYYTPTIFGNNTVSVAPTSTQFTVGNYAGVNASGGTYVAYIFAHDAGGFGLTGTDNVISCGSFTTDGSGNATVNLGYEPQYLLFKRTDTTGGWFIVDNMRGFANYNATTGNNNIQTLQAQASAAEGSSTIISPTATGFTNGSGLATSATFIYIAIRRGPMKVPTDATKVFNTFTGGDFTPITTGFPVDAFLDMYRPSSLAGGKIMASRLTGSQYLITSSTNAEATNGNPILWDSNTTVAPQYLGYSGTVVESFRRAPSFFDEVCYTGTGSATTFNHNLGAVPEMMIVKSRSATANWAVYHKDLNGGVTPEQCVIYLNNTNSQTVGSSAWWNSTAPTSTVFSVNTAAQTNASGTTYVSYLFSTCAGVSKVGSYTGNGGTQAIACGFAGGARFVLIRRIDASGDWYVYDTARGMTTLTDPYLLLNSTAAESATLGSVTTTTGGFTVNASILAAINTNAASYIFLAIA